MKRWITAVCALAALSFFAANPAIAAEIGKMETRTGKVTAVDPHSTALVFSARGGARPMDVGVIVDRDTSIRTGGKPATLGDIRVGDTVTVRYLKSDDLYAREIVKR